MCFNVPFLFSTRMAFAEECAGGDHSLFAVESLPPNKIETILWIEPPCPAKENKIHTQKHTDNHLSVYIPLKSFS